MKKNNKSNISDFSNNNINICGKVTFVKKFGKVTNFGKVANIGIKTTYTYNGNEFTSYPVIKVFDNVDKTGFENVTDIEKGDTIEVKAHYVSSKYKSKDGNEQFVLDLVAHDIIASN